MTNKLTRTAPKRIWLQTDASDPSHVHDPFPPVPDGDITWCHESAGGAEVEYVRADLVRAAMPKNWANSKALYHLGMELGLNATVRWWVACGAGKVQRILGGIK